MFTSRSYGGVVLGINGITAFCLFSGNTGEFSGTAMQFDACAYCYRKNNVGSAGFDIVSTYLIAILI